VLPFFVTTRNFLLIIIRRIEYFHFIVNEKQSNDQDEQRSNDSEVKIKLCFYTQKCFKTFKICTFSLIKHVTKYVNVLYGCMNLEKFLGKFLIFVQNFEVFTKGNFVQIFSSCSDGIGHIFDIFLKEN
jgi:hypothetical protein